jgi:tight adherence protein C
MEIFFGAIFLALSAVFFIDAVRTRSRKRRAALARVPSYAAAELQTSPMAAARRARARREAAATPRPVTEALARIALRLSGEPSIDEVQSKLTAAGLADRVSPTTFLASKVVLLLLGLVLGALLGGIAGSAASITFALAFGALGLIWPSLYVKGRINARKARIRADLPTAFDILSISVEAGLSLDSALETLTARIEGPLADELKFTMAELEIGESRREALRKLADRVDLPEMKSFVNALQQGDQLGISLGEILRTVATDSRRRHRAEAEERANKMAVKIMFPVVFLIMPVIFLIAVGPGFILLKQLLSG